MVIPTMLMMVVNGGVSDGGDDIGNNDVDKNNGAFFQIHQVSMVLPKHLTHQLLLEEEKT